MSFTPGYIFGARARRDRSWLAKEFARKRDAMFSMPPKNPISRFFWRKFGARRAESGDWWRYWNTPIKEYGAPLVDVTELLRKERGKKIKILDVGIGQGSQWLRILKRNRGIEFHGTTLNENYDPALKNVKPIHVGELHKHYGENTFDYVFSHLGIHEQPFEGIENIMHVLKPGGQAVIILSPDESDVPVGEERSLFEAQEFYEILGFNTGVSMQFFMPQRSAILLHIRKKVIE